MNTSISVRVDLGSLPAATKLLGGMNTVPPPPRIAQMFNQWGKRYEAFIRRRFNTFSRGGGDWPPLAKSTVDRRRGPKQAVRLRSIASGKRKAKVNEATFLARDTARGGKLVQASRSYAILKDTGILFNSLTIGAFGNRLTPIAGGIQYGFTNASHGSKRGKSISVGRLATIHHRGLGRNPVRTILVRPDDATLGRMRNDASRAIRDILRGGGA